MIVRHDLCGGRGETLSFPFSRNYTRSGTSGWALSLRGVTPAWGRYQRVGGCTSAYPRSKVLRWAKQIKGRQNPKVPRFYFLPTLPWILVTSLDPRDPLGTQGPWNLPGTPCEPLCNHMQDPFWKGITRPCITCSDFCNSIKAKQ